MKTRTLTYALLAVLAVSALAAGPNASRYAAFEIVARDPDTNETHSAYVKLALAEPTTAPPTTVAPKPTTASNSTQTFAIGIEPSAAKMQPGTSQTFRVVLKT